MYGSDQSASLEPSGMIFLTEAIEKFINSFGENRIGDILKEEIPIAEKLRAHIKS